MYCSNCGNKTLEGANFCAVCGRALNAPQQLASALPVQPPSLPTPETVIESTLVAVPTPESAQYPTINTSPKPELARVIIESKNEEATKTAVELLTSEAIVSLIKSGRQSHAEALDLFNNLIIRKNILRFDCDSDKTVRPVTSLSDQSELSRVVMEAHNEEAVKLAAELLTDQKMISHILKEGKFYHSVKDMLFAKLTDQETMIYLLKEFKGFSSREIVPKLTDQTIVSILRSGQNTQAEAVDLLNCLIEHKNPDVFELALAAYNKIYRNFLNMKEMAENFEYGLVREFICQFFEKVFLSTPDDLMCLHGNKYAHDRSMRFFEDKVGYKSISGNELLYFSWFTYEGSSVGILLNIAAVTGADMKPVIEKICKIQNETVLLLILDEARDLLYERSWAPSYHIELNESQKNAVRSWVPDEDGDIIRSLARLEYAPDIINTRFGDDLLFFYPSFSTLIFDSMVGHLSDYDFEKFMEIIESELQNGRSDRVSAVAEKKDTPLKFYVFMSRALTHFINSDKMNDFVFAEQINKLSKLMRDENAIAAEYLDKRISDDEKSLGDVVHIYSLNELGQFGVTYDEYEREEEDGYGRYTYTDRTYYYKGKSFK